MARRYTEYTFLTAAVLASSWVNNRSFQWHSSRFCSSQALKSPDAALVPFGTLERFYHSKWNTTPVYFINYANMNGLFFSNMATVKKSTVLELP